MTQDSLTDRFDGTSPDPVPDGGILTVKLVHPEKPGQVVTVIATDGDDSTETSTLEIKLRGNGRGSALFIVPAGWGSVVLTCEDSRPHSIAVALPP
jgi:hypothetical protein